MGLEAWRIDRVDGISVLRCAALLECRGVGHAFSTRQAWGGSEFDLGSHDATCKTIEVRRRALCEAAGLPGRQPATLRQVHGARVVRWDETSEPHIAADAVTSTREDASGTAVPAVRTADCVPLLLADRDGEAVAAVHAGWRGTAARIAMNAVDALAALGVPAGRLVAALGPAIGPCCYEVGEEVLGAVARSAPDGSIAPRSRTLDLRLANRLQLEGAGLHPSAIHIAPWCTACHPELFFSHRRDGVHAGRQLACIGWTASVR